MIYYISGILFDLRYDQMHFEVHGENKSTTVIKRFKNSNDEEPEMYARFKNGKVIIDEDSFLDIVNDLVESAEILAVFQHDKKTEYLFKENSMYVAIYDDNATVDGKPHVTLFDH